MNSAHKNTPNDLPAAGHSAVTCEWMDEAITHYLVDELAAAERAQVEAHVAGCYACKEELAARRLALVGLRSGIAPRRISLGSDARGKLVSAAAAATAAPIVMARPQRNSRLLAWTGSIAALFLLGCVSYGLLRPTILTGKEKSGGTQDQLLAKNCPPVDSASVTTRVTPTTTSAPVGGGREYFKDREAHKQNLQNVSIKQRESPVIPAQEDNSFYTVDIPIAVNSENCPKGFDASEDPGSTGYISDEAKTSLRKDDHLDLLKGIKGEPKSNPDYFRDPNGSGTMAPGAEPPADHESALLVAARRNLDEQQLRDLEEALARGVQEGKQRSEEKRSKLGDGRDPSKGRISPGAGGQGGEGYRFPDQDRYVVGDGADGASSGLYDGGDPETRVRRIYTRLCRRPSESPSMMFFRYWGDNAFVDALSDPFATFAVDVDTASYTLARNYLSRGTLPPKEAIRTEEFVNYFPSQYAAPAEGDFAIYSELAPSFFSRQPDVHLLKIGVKAREVPAGERKPIALTLVIDVSGSMSTENRLELVKDSIRMLLADLDARDSIGIVVFESTARDILEPVSATELDTVAAALAPLSPGSSTNVEHGLSLGYAMARRQFKANGINRVALFSDGVANTGATTAETILQHVAEQRSNGVFLSCFGVGMGNHNDALLEQLAGKGDGQCSYIDSRAEAARSFRKTLTSNFQTIAKDAKVQVEFDRNLVACYRQIGYENRAVADREFRNDFIDAGEINAGHEMVALFEIQLRPEACARMARENLTPAVARLRYRRVEGGDVVELAHNVLSCGIVRFQDASPRFRLSAVAAAFADLLRNSYWSRQVRFGEVVEMARSLTGLDSAADGKVAELIALMAQAERLITGREQVAATNTIERQVDTLRYNYYLNNRLDDLRCTDPNERIRLLEEQNRKLEAALRELLGAGSAPGTEPPK